MFRPRNIDQHFQTLFVGQVEEPARRGVIHAKQIGVKFPDALEIGRGLFRGGESSAVLVRCERAVGDPLQKKLLPGETEELPVHDDAIGWRTWGSGNHGSGRVLRVKEGPRDHQTTDHATSPVVLWSRGPVVPRWVLEFSKPALRVRVLFSGRAPGCSRSVSQALC